MTSAEIFRLGSVIENYSYINPDDLEGQYVGHLVVFEKKVYEIVTDINNKIVEFSYEPRLVSEDVDKMYEEIEIYDSEPEMNYIMESGTGLQDWKVMVDMFSPVSK